MGARGTDDRSAVSRGPGNRDHPRRGRAGGAYEIVASGEQLARTLMSTGRTRPAAVVAWHPGTPGNRIDVGRIAREVGDLADVYYLENGPETFRFADALPAGAHVYGNAARVYSADLDWLRDVYRSPLRMAQSPGGAAAAAERIIEDVLEPGHGGAARSGSAQTAGRDVGGGEGLCQCRFPGP